MKLLLALVSFTLLAQQSIVVIPDVHGGASSPQTTWAQQSAWIVANKSTYNIVAALATGDFDEGGSGLTWDDAANGHAGANKIVAAGITWAAAAGNHDYDTTVYDGNTSVFDAALGYDKATGSEGTTKDKYTDAQTKASYWVKTTINGRPTLLLFLQFYPYKSTHLAWASTVVSANQDRDVLVFTHAYMTHLGELIQSSNPGAACAHDAPPNCYTNYYGVSMWKDGTAASGAEIQAWAAQYQNVRAVFGGHWLTNNETYNRNKYHAHRQDVGVTGTPLQGFYTNFQEQSPTHSQLVLLVQFFGVWGRATLYNTATGAASTDFPPYWFRLSSGLWGLAGSTLSPSVVSLSWTTLTNAQWTSMTNSQWTSMTN